MHLLHSKWVRYRNTITHCPLPIHLNVVNIQTSTNTKWQTNTGHKKKIEVNLFKHSKYFIDLCFHTTFHSWRCLWMNLLCACFAYTNFFSSAIWYSHPKIQCKTMTAGCWMLNAMPMHSLFVALLILIGLAFCSLLCARHLHGIFVCIHPGSWYRFGSMHRLKIRHIFFTVL